MIPIWRGSVPQPNSANPMKTKILSKETVFYTLTTLVGLIAIGLRSLSLTVVTTMCFLTYEALKIKPRRNQKVRRIIRAVKLICEHSSAVYTIAGSCLLVFQLIATTLVVLCNSWRHVHLFYAMDFVCYAFAFVAFLLGCLLEIPDTRSQLLHKALSTMLKISLALNAISVPIMARMGTRNDLAVAMKILLLAGMLVITSRLSSKIVQSRES